MIGAVIGVLISTCIVACVGALKSYHGHRRKNATDDSEREWQEGFPDQHQLSAYSGLGKKRPRAFAIASLSLGILSIVSILGSWFLFPLFPAPLALTLVLGLGILSAIVGFTLGIYQVIRHRSAIVLAGIGVVFSLVGGGVFFWGVLFNFYGDTNYTRILTGMGYDVTVIDNPIPAEFFQAVDKPTAQWIYSGAVAPLGWSSHDQQGEIPIEIPLTGAKPTEPVFFEPGDSKFSLFIKFDGVYEWYMESARNIDGRSHVKIYPIIIDGREIPNSYLICWEDYPLDKGPSHFIDFTDLIVRLNGVKLVSSLPDE